MTEPLAKRRVVHLSRGFGDYVISLAEELADVVDLVVVLSKADECLALEFPPSVRVEKLGAPPVAKLNNWRWMSRWRSLVDSIQPDIVHLQNGLIWEPLAVFPRRRWSIVTTIHDVTRHPYQQPWHGTPQVLLDYWAEKSDALIIHSQALARQADVRYACANREQMRSVIPHPVITRYGVGEARVIASGNILFFGAIERYKGLDVLLRGIELVGRRGCPVTLRVCGPCREPERYQGILGDASSVIWSIGFQDEAAVKAAFCWADVVVLPYLEASQSGVLFLAKSFGVPVVVSDVGSLGETVRHEQTGLVVRPGDSERLARAIHRLLVSEQLRRKIITQIVNERDASIAARTVGVATAELYERVIQERQKREGIRQSNVFGW